MKNLILILSLLLSFSGFSQNENFYAQPDKILIGNKSVPKVMIVGTFHFSYPGLDGHKTKETDKINVLSPKRQKEIDELADYIARFKPTKIVVEGGRNTGYLMWNYRDYKSGKEKMKADEIHQIGFRLLDKFKLDTLYGCDSYSMMNDMTNSKDSVVFKAYFDDLFKDYDWKSDDPINDLYGKWYDSMDKATLSMTLLENFKIMNSNKVIERMHGAYLIGDFKLKDFKGADALSLFWYNRNLRIFNNIQSRVDAQPDDRILVLFGAGHTAILREQFIASPEYELVNFWDLKNEKN